MNKGELVEELYQKNNLTKRECREAINLVIGAIAETVAGGENVKLVNFGIFEPSPRQATNKVHPVTGEEIDVPAKVVPNFRSGKGFDEAVAENLKVSRDGSGELKVERK